ncbi:hypothetical protein TNCV_3543991, partial [Trichonephila clavipes]
FQQRPPSSSTPCRNLSNSFPYDVHYSRSKELSTAIHTSNRLKPLESIIVITMGKALLGRICHIVAKACIRRVLSHINGKPSLRRIESHNWKSLFLRRMKSHNMWKAFFEAYKIT